MSYRRHRAARMFATTRSYPRSRPPVPVLHRPLQERFAEEVAGRYRVERLLGRGGSAMVYLAHDLKHGRPVALKLLDPVTAPAAGEALFQREIALVAQLQHPHILPLHDSGEAAGSLYFVMPYLPGETLRARLRRAGALAPADAVRVALEMAGALAYAHARGVVHRDVKPENVLLTGEPAPGLAPGEHAVVCDFGIARLTRGDSPGAGAAVGGVGRGSRELAVGTPAYMAPEQAAADPQVDARADVWAVGLVLYEMLTGRLPHADEGVTAAQALARRAGGPPAPLGRELATTMPRPVGRAIDAVLARALAPDPAARFASAAELLAPLRAAQAALTPSAAPAGPFANVRARWAAAAAAVGLFAVAAVGAGAVRDHWAEGAPLDPSLVVVLPFADERAAATGGGADSAGVAAAAVDGRGAEQLLLDAFGRWTDLRVVNATRVNDAVARAGGRGPRTVDEALAIARRLGAGRLAWGTVAAAPGTPGRTAVRAALYDVARPDDALREHDVTVGAALPDLGARFAELADSLLLGDARSRVALPGALGTTSWRAWRAYDRGHDALARWDLPTASAAFGEAALADPNYALAARWRAQTYAWMTDAPRAEWQHAAERAAALAERLAPADAQAARALAALANGRYQEACAGYRQLVARDSLDYAAWFGLGDCQAKDDLVVRDPRSPSGWRFRSSYRGAIAAYQRVLANLPSVHLAFGGAAVTYLPRLLVANNSQARSGYALVGGDTLRFAALPSLDADTLAFVPYPQVDFAALRPGTMPPTRAAALRRNRLLLLAIAERWTAAFPRSVQANELHALALESLGRLDTESNGSPGALDLLRRANTLVPGDADARSRLGIASLRVLVKLQRFDAVSLLADSLLAAPIVAGSPATTRMVAVAALTGRARRAADLARAAVRGVADQPDELSDLPADAREAAAAGYTYLALGAPADSARAGWSRVAALTTRSRGGDPAAGAAREQFRRRGAVLAFSVVGRSALDEVDPAGYFLLELQAAAGRGDRAAARERFRVLAARRAADPSSNLSIDAAFQEAWVHALLGDGPAAARVLDGALGALPSQGTLMLSDAPRAASVGRAMRLRAALARRANDAEGARRWDAAVAALWRQGDAEVRSAPAAP